MDTRNINIASVKLISVSYDITRPYGGTFTGRPLDIDIRETKTNYFYNIALEYMFPIPKKNAYRITAVFRVNIKKAFDIKDQKNEETLKEIFILKKDDGDLTDIGRILIPPVHKIAEEKDNIKI